MKLKINKPKLNLTIDVIMFVVLMAIAGIGFLIKYVLVPGFKRNEIYGRDVELYFWGIDRHEWGSIHLILSFILLFLLLLHIIFHWKQIVCIFKCMLPSRVWRLVLTIAIIILTFLLGILPIFLKPEIHQVKGGNYHANHSENNHIEKSNHVYQKEQVRETKKKQEISDTKSAHSHSEEKSGERIGHLKDKDFEIYGYMTLNEVSDKYSIPVSELAQAINIPEKHSGEKLGRLRKRYGFHLNDLREYVKAYSSE